MDENQPHRRWLTFGIRDMLWAMVVAALALGWITDHTRQATRYRTLSETIVSVGGLGLTYSGDGQVTFHNRANPHRPLGELDVGE